MDTAFLFDIYLKSVRKYKAGRIEHLLPSAQDYGVEYLLSNSLAKGRVGVRTESIDLAEASR